MSVALYHYGQINIRCNKLYGTALTLPNTLNGALRCQKWSSFFLVCFQFVVSHGWDIDGLHRVCLVDGRGHVTTAHGQRSGSRPGQLKHPTQLAVSIQRGRTGRLVLVADRGNDRVMVLSPSLTCGRQLPLGVDVLGPYAICLDEDDDRLYVGEGGGSTVYVFTNVVSCLRQMVA